MEIEKLRYFIYKYVYWNISEYQLIIHVPGNHIIFNFNIM